MIEDIGKIRDLSYLESEYLPTKRAKQFLNNFVSRNFYYTDDYNPLEILEDTLRGDSYRLAEMTEVKLNSGKEFKFKNYSEAVDNLIDCINNSKNYADAMFKYLARGFGYREDSIDQYFNKEDEDHQPSSYSEEDDYKPSVSRQRKEQQAAKKSSEESGDNDEEDNEENNNDNSKSKGKVRKTNKRMPAGTDRTAGDNSAYDGDFVDPKYWPATYDTERDKLNKLIREFKFTISNIEKLDIVGEDEYTEDPDGGFTKYVRGNPKEQAREFLKDNSPLPIKLLKLKNKEYYVWKAFKKVTKRKNIVLFVDNSSSMAQEARMAKTYAAIEYFLDKYKQGELDLLICMYQIDIDFVHDIEKYRIESNSIELNNKGIKQTTGLINYVKSKFIIPYGGGTNTPNAVAKFIEGVKKGRWDTVCGRDHKKFLPSPETKYIIVNDGDDSCSIDFPTETHAVCVGDKENKQIKNFVIKSGGSYTVL